MQLPLDTVTPDLLNHDPVTVVASRVVKAHRAEAFRDWARRVDAALAQRPGHIGTVRLSAPGGLFHLVYQFGSADALAGWEATDAYRALMAEAEAFSIMYRQVKPGARAWFAIPGEGSAAKWRQALMTWTMVLPLLLALNGAIGLLPFTLPLPVRLALSSIVMTAVLTWLILPRVSRLLRPWMLRDDDGLIRH